MMSMGVQLILVFNPIHRFASFFSGSLANSCPVRAFRTYIAGRGVN